ncbi:electron transport complex subunit RsxC [Arenimonas fontis]|uniref:Ion-translocating oxidoreductase complex subunit C n=1 Tax=Arenimonas fontis TaxID=2608255 RepID=A0A5B2ZCQ9_9GAMM|nr:electron transport complex subunit RsxC [Arenimonas fontis]KAA2285715.1 electron transport complex subunit RsxC [Arenimonas fontis]
MRPHRFHGGLRLDGHKAESTAGGLHRAAMPAQLRVSLLQHAGYPAEPCVAEGQHVLRGQRIGIAGQAPGVDVHSPCAGRVLALAEEEAPQWPGMRAMHVVIRPEPPHDTVRLPALDWSRAKPEELRARVREAGLAGLGGAGFPTADKLAAGRDLLILNGAECEPWIACDDALLRAHADEVVLGGRMLARAVGAGRIRLAIEDSMPAALAACREAIARHGEAQVELVVVPTIYPEGGERQLIQALTGLEVPRGGLPRDLGVIVLNVGTARAAWRAVAQGEPLVERIVTVTGAGVVRPGNYVVPLGMTVAQLVAQAGGYTADAARLLLGGPMMGIALPHDDVPLGKTHNCVLVLSTAQLPDAAPEMPCIRCGDCAEVCPSRLLPQMLLRQVRAQQFAAAEEQGLPDCIECGCCDLVCPSHIPLTAHFRHGKAELRRHADEAVAAQAARERYEARGRRLAREAAERERRLAARKAATSADAVAAAIERARVRKAERTGDDPP